MSRFLVKCKKDFLLGILGRPTSCHLFWSIVRKKTCLENTFPLLLQDSCDQVEPLYICKPVSLNNEKTEGKLVIL